MGRPLSFDKHQALEAATMLIWSRGYHAASMAELVAATGLNKSSLYNSFGSKHQVLTEAIDHYTTAQVRMLNSLLAAKGFRTGVRALLDSIIESNNDGRGCLLVNCAAELAPRDRRIARRVRAGLDELAAVLAARAAQAQTAGQLSRRINCQVLASSLINFICGLRVLVKAGMDRDSLRHSVRQSLKALLPASP
ncbi:MAG: TetR/AcrR family transcriptional regulator [Proteobacteria bacterium]|nr:TetR/AcrR family transcriptional regulator [Pseudomonadota bacterium]